MARPGITFEIVAHAADALVGRGEKPTIQAIRAEIGTGSPNTIHRHLTAWKATQAPAERQSAKLPDELAGALAQEIERQASAARAEAEADALDARQTADELAETGEALEAEADALREQIEQVTAERDEAVRDRSEARSLIKEFRAQVKQLEQQRDDARQELAEARNRITTLTEQRDQEHSARLDAQRDTKAAEKVRVDAERAQAVAMAKLEAGQQQAAERLEALKSEQQGRKADTDAHKQAMADLRNEWRERLTAAEKQAQDAQNRAQEADKAKTKAEVRAEALADRLNAIEPRDVSANTEQG